MIAEPTSYPTFYNQTIDHYNNIWYSLQVEIIIGIAAIIIMLIICITLIEKFISYRESMREQIVPINSHNII